MESSIENRPNNKIEYGELLKPYLRRWTWFVSGTIIALIIAFLYIRYTTPKYAITAKLQILEDQSAASELSAFNELEMFSSGNTQVEDEIEILNSRTNMIEVARQLGLNTKILALGQIHDTELYGNAAPFKINFLIPDSLVYVSKAEFLVEVTSETSFAFQEINDQEGGPIKNYSFGGKVNSTIGDIVLIPNKDEMSAQRGREFKVILQPLNFVAQAYKNEILITVSDELSNVISISLNDAVVQKAKDIVNGLIDTYNGNAIEDKRLIADRTSEFINDRIAEIYGDLSQVDQTEQEFKAGRGIANVASQTSSNIDISAQSQQELENAQFQLNSAASMKDIIDNMEGYEVLPSNIGLNDPTIASTTATYNQLLSERNRLLRSSNEKNPVIVSLDEQLNSLRRSLQSSLNSMTNTLDMRVNNLSSRLSTVKARIFATPGNERALRDIARQQQTTEALYLYLLQKREESQITFASATPKSKIIDRAYEISKFPVSPKKSIIFLACLILGILIPFSLINLLQLLDNKVRNKVTLEKYVGDIPVLAELPKISKKENTLVRTGERTVLAESLRILRTNIDFIIKSKKETGKKGNIIYVTSSVPGEGKTLVSANLAMIFAKANKKVLLLGADIRNPKIYQFYSGKNVDHLGKIKRDKSNIGLTEYLVDRNIRMDQIITPVLAHDQTVDVIYSGKIMPNPAELLMSDRMKELLSKVRAEYDYVIVDTAPLMVVSDTLLISEFADQILYVVRANVTDLKVLDFPLKLYKEGKLNGLAFVVNGVKDANLGYGGKYGYGYDMKSQKWWQFS